MSARIAILTTPQLIELELIEPDLYLGHDAQAGARFAESVLDSIAARAGRT